MSIITARNITKSFGDLSVLNGIDVEIKTSEIVSIVGASGAGKSTLLQIIGTLLPLEKESFLSIDDIDISSLNDGKISKLRNEKIGFIFQSHGLLPEFTAIENVMLPALIKGVKRNIAKGRAKELIAMLGLADRLNHKPKEMSGGEAQRIAVARALINEPSVVLADEPTGSLDSKNSESLQNLFFELRKELSQTFVIITHDEIFSKKCDRQLYIKDGLIINKV